tara:strand:+ start:2128 stop:3534 length:1407 start_codon:yes stop_codon:yes gene_type:complete
MDVIRDKRQQTKERGLVRWLVTAHREHRLGIAQRRSYRVDDNGNSFETRAAACAYRKILEGRIVTGTAGDTDRTFADAFAAWEANQDEKVALGIVAPATSADDVALARNHILHRLTLRGVPIADVRLVSIDYGLLRHELVRSRAIDGETVRGQLFTTGLSRRSVVKLVQRLRAIFQAAVEERWIGHNPVASLSVPLPTPDPADKALDPRVYRRFSDDQTELFAALEVIAPELVLPLQTIRRTGIRIGELRALSLEQIEVGESVTAIKIDRAYKNNDAAIGKPKNKTTRFVAVDVAAGRELVAHAVRHGRRGGAPLFGDARGPLNEASVRLAWYQAQFAIRGWLFCRSSNTRDTGRAYRLIRLPQPIGEFTTAEFSSFKFGQAGLQKGEAREDGEVFASIADAAAHAGLTLFRLHDLRHLYASVLFAAGISLRKVAQRIGDTEATTQTYYVHWLATDEDDDLEAIAAIG